MPNIISSYVAEEVFQKDNWLTEGIYKDILDLFDYNAKQKINLSDNQQSFIPYFSGHLNFIASANPNFWYLYIRLHKTNKVFSFDKLIFSNEIPKLCKFLEEKISGKENGRTKKFFETSILRVNLAKQLRRSVLKYNKMITENAIKVASLRDDHKEQEIAKPSIRKVYQCKHCFTIYDPYFGDLLNNIPVGVPFSKLPATYVCPTCEADKKDFKVLEIENVSV